MSFNTIVAALALLAVFAAGTVAAAEPPGETEQARDEARDAAGPEQRALPRSELGVTMRIIENPEALGSDAVTRRIVLPAPVAASNEGEAPGAAPRGRETSEQAREQAREQGREFGIDASERGREMSEQARERREEFGRSRAEEARPETPQPPPRPRPPGP
jgi:hypothetical protein